MSTEVNPVSVLSEAFDRLSAENQELKESIASVRAMMSYEDIGWTALGAWASGSHLEGLDLDEVQSAAEIIEPKVAAGSLPKRAVDLHSGFVWGRGCFIEGTEKPKRGRPSNTRAFYIDPVNQESIFSDTAREELQKARFITGNVLVVCNKRTKKVNRIPFKQITNLRVDPEFPENILAYQRTWDTKDGSTDSIKKRWYFTPRHEGPIPGPITEDNVAIAVDQDSVIVDLRVNRQVGHVLGIPDALAGLLWSEAYGRIMSYGETVQESLAKILFRVTNKTKQGTQTSGVKIANFGGHGGTASMMEGQELSAVQTAGRGYDFSSARPMAAMAAAAWNVSNMDLLNDSSAAGSSYGSANALVGGNRNAMLLMQKEWADFYKRIFEAMGYDRPAVMFEPFEAPDKYREMQSLKLGQDALSDEEYRMKVLDIQDISGDPTEIPESLKLAVDAAKAAVQQAAPDQGVANGAGGGQGANDQRSDGIGEALRREMVMTDLVERFEAALVRAETLSTQV